MVHTLLLNGADQNATTKCERQTPVHMAATEGHALCVSMSARTRTRETRAAKQRRTVKLLSLGSAVYNRLGAVEEHACLLVQTSTFAAALPSYAMLHSMLPRSTAMRTL